MWQPRHLRERSEGRFEWRDYRLHCELGGHPTPKGLRAFLNDREGTSGAVVLVDSLNHAVRIWWSIMAVAREVRRVNGDALNRSLERWHTQDGLPAAMANGLATEVLS